MSQETIFCCDACGRRVATNAFTPAGWLSLAVDTESNDDDEPEVSVAVTVIVRWDLCSWICARQVVEEQIARGPRTTEAT